MKVQDLYAQFQTATNIMKTDLMQQILTELDTQHGIWIMIGKSFACFNVLSIKVYDEIGDDNFEVDLDGFEFADFTSSNDAYCGAIDFVFENKVLDMKFPDFEDCKIVQREKNQADILKVLEDAQPYYKENFLNILAGALSEDITANHLQYKMGCES